METLWNELVTAYTAMPLNVLIGLLLIGIFSAAFNMSASKSMSKSVNDLTIEVKIEDKTPGRIVIGLWILGALTMNVWLVFTIQIVTIWFVITQSHLVEPFINLFTPSDEKLEKMLDKIDGGNISLKLGAN